MFQCQLFFIYQALVFSTTWPSRGVRHEVRNKSDAQVTSRDLMGEIHQYQRHLVSGDFGKFRLCLVSLPSDWTGVARRWNLSSPDTFCVHPWYFKFFFKKPHFLPECRWASKFVWFLRKEQSRCDPWDFCSPTGLELMILVNNAPPTNHYKVSTRWLRWWTNGHQTGWVMLWALFYPYPLKKNWGCSIP